MLLPEWMELRINLLGMDISPIKLNSTFESTCIKLLLLLFGIFCLVQNQSINKKNTPEKYTLDFEHGYGCLGIVITLLK